MTFKDRLNSIFSTEKATNNRTIEMLSAMKNTSQKRIKSMSIGLSLTAQNLTKKDIDTWRKAWQMAINPENPQRLRLYDVYTDVCADAHVSGCIDQRTGMVMQKAFKIIDNNGNEKPELTELLEANWFKEFCAFVLDSRYWGHSLIEFGDLLTSSTGNLYFERVSLVPRRHVIPEFGLIVKEAGDEPKNGIDYKKGKLSQWVIDAGDPFDLGLLLKVSPSALSKKNMLAYWDNFGELFGMPVRIATTTSRDEKEITKTEKMLEDMGAKSWALFPEGTTVEFKESSRGDAFNVYDRRIDRANSEISKCLLNQTMTIDSGSSYSQSEVHLEVFKNIVESDADFLRDIINNKLLPFLVVHGFPLDGYMFNWDDTINYTPEEMRTIEQMLLTAGYEIEPDYFIEKYNIPIIGKREIQPFLKKGDNDFFV
ncbi:MAG: DUF935 domain-containing protein [Holosporaceae bacterium]|jgi:hypothetical protein|nr:DUF935 domain-containing protein [Holosporaceae bacterium]